MIRFTARVAALALLSLSAAPSSVGAETFPEKTIRIIVPTAPGGSIDSTARLIADRMQAKWGKPVVIENRPGAGMRIGAEAAARSPADGYTLLAAHDGTLAINAAVYPDLPYDPQRDFAPLGLVVTIPEALMVNVNVPASSIPELVALARKEPGQLTHATGGSATLLALELFNAMAGVDIRSIPYRGGAPAVTATIAGETSMIIADLSTGNPALRSDRIRPLAITSMTRSRQYPNLPTLDEQGVSGYEVNTWIGFFAPAATPRGVRAKLEEAIKEAVAMPDVRARLEATAMNVRSGTAEEMAKLLASDIAKWSKLVREKNIRIP
jgi:tripartite-type tricarboxylate transporter receptor subunit TctC